MLISHILFSRVWGIQGTYECKVPKARKFLRKRWTMQDGTPRLGNIVLDHPRMVSGMLLPSIVLSVFVIILE
jgi:hypothetical protein